jgi:hypothetical protein
MQPTTKETTDIKMIDIEKDKERIVERNRKAAYIGGFIDGEGCFTITKRNTTQAKRGYVLTPMAVVANTNVSILEQIQVFLGVGNIVTKTSTNPRAKPCYHLQFTANEIRNIIPKLLPHLYIKQEQAKLLSDFLSSTDDKQRLEYYYKIKKLNIRGVSNDAN